MAYTKWILLASMVVVVAAEKEPLPSEEEALAMMKDCQIRYPIDDKEFEEVMLKKNMDKYDRLTKCYIHCFMHQIKMISPEGVLDVDKIYDVVIYKHKKELKEDPLNAIKDCAAQATQKNVCEKSFAVTKCITDKKLWN